MSNLCQSVATSFEETATGIASDEGLEQLEGSFSLNMDVSSQAVSCKRQIIKVNPDGKSLRRRET
jgi:hypothetical protein